MLPAPELRESLKKEIPELWAASSAIASRWTAQIIHNLDGLAGDWIAFPKTFTDPVLGPIELFEWEVAILDSPLLQRLRGIRQLGMAYAVYAGASHDRLSHSLGVLQLADQMIQALQRNAQYHRNYGPDVDTEIPTPLDEDRFIIRLAALLHDIGHGPFSHASEPLIQKCHWKDFAKLSNSLRSIFEGSTDIRISEAVAVLLILSEPMSRVFEHVRFRPSHVLHKEQLPVNITARLLGSWMNLQATYLSGIISGTIDADKLDYMARDSYFTGLPLGLDVERLISKLEVVTITPQNVTQKAVRERAEAAATKKLHELGISVAGLNRRMFFVLIAFKPSSEAAIPPVPARVSVHRLAGSLDECVYVRFLVPWGTGTPSTAKAPSKRNT